MNNTTFIEGLPGRSNVARIFIFQTIFLKLAKASMCNPVEIRVCVAAFGSPPEEAKEGRRGYGKGGDDEIMSGRRRHRLSSKLYPFRNVRRKA